MLLMFRVSSFTDGQLPFQEKNEHPFERNNQTSIIKVQGEKGYAKKTKENGSNK